MYFLEIMIEQKPKNGYEAEFFSYLYDTTSVTHILCQLKVIWNVRITTCVLEKKKIKKILYVPGLNIETTFN